LAKLSIVQQHMVDLMKQGWELRRTEGIAPQAFLTLGAISRTIRITTFFALVDKGLLERKRESFPFIIYGLKEN